MNENKYPLVTYPRDPRFLTLRSLQTPQDRSRTGLYIIEGIRHVARAVEHNAPIESVFLDPSVLSNSFGRKLARRLRKRCIPGIRLSHQLYLDLTLATEPQGIGAILRQKWTSLDEVRARPNLLWLAVESIESPGNLGTIIRTTEAAGATGTFILNRDCDPYDPATVRATMGSLFSQKLIRCSPHEFTNWAKSNGVAVVASSPAGLMDYKALSYRFPAALIIGSEKRGLFTQVLEVADFVVRIPMLGGCDSINAAVAAGVLLFEMSSQRQGLLTPPATCGIRLPL
jgi:TrmH family RNA methyltransferase